MLFTVEVELHAPSHADAAIVALFIRKRMNEVSRLADSNDIGFDVGDWGIETRDEIGDLVS